MISWCQPLLGNVLFVQFSFWDWFKLEIVKCVPFLKKYVANEMGSSILFSIAPLKCFPFFSAAFWSGIYVCRT